MSGALDAHYDVLVVGTSLPNAILSAALSRSGYKVLHIDEADHYGGPWASLTLQELLDWSRLHSEQSLHEHGGDDGAIKDVDLAFPAFFQAGTDDVQEGSRKDSLPPELQRLNRHFSLSLAPALLPCKGPTIDVLVRSKVASYCTFRLLERTSVYHGSDYKSATSITTSSSRSSSNECTNPSSSASGSSQIERWPLRKVPSSKEDIFKDKTMKLADKRRLMKLLQEAAAVSDGAIASGAAASSTNTLAGRRDIGVEAQEEEPSSFLRYLTDEAKLSLDLARDVAFGVALCSSSADTKTAAMERIKTHIESVGRYGNSAYLVGQYGGAGEMAQCFCRAAAVQGATFVLDHAIERLEKVGEKEGSWKLKLQGVEGETLVDCVVGDAECLNKKVPKRTAKASSASREAKRQRSTTRMRGILVLDRSIPFDDPSFSPSSTMYSESRNGAEEDGEVTSGEGRTKQKPLPPETALIVFPPDEAVSQAGAAVTALQMGEGTFSCPKGTYVVYLSSSLPQLQQDAGRESQNPTDSKTFFKPYRDRILDLAGKNPSEFQMPAEGIPEQRLEPLMELYYSQTDEGSSGKDDDDDDVESAEEEEEGVTIIRVPFPPRLSSPFSDTRSSTSQRNDLVSSLDLASRQAEEIFWDLMVILSDDESSSLSRQTKEKRRSMAQSLKQKTAEAKRRRRKKTYAVGQGLGGVIEGSNAEDVKQQDDIINADFFPVEEEGDAEMEE